MTEQLSRASTVTYFAFPLSEAEEDMWILEELWKQIG